LNIAEKKFIGAGRQHIPPFFPLLKLIAVLLMSFLYISCNSSGGDDKWNVLVYMDADNELEDAALVDLSEMEAAVSSDNVNVIVQLDLRNGIGTKRYQVINGSSQLLTDLGELDMASPETITSFLTWAKDTYPADKTFLILWNHGNGWDQGDGPSSPSTGIISRSIFYDEDNGSPFLPNHQVKLAIENSGINIDILGLDACSMGTIEALYEFCELPGLEIIISSQEVGEWYGWDYKAILSRLSRNPGISVEYLSKVVVSSYEKFYEEIFYPSFPLKEKLHTISALRADDIRAVAEEADLLAEKLTGLLEAPETREEALLLIGYARETVQKIDLYIKPYVYVDLVDLDTLLGQGTEIASLTAAATIAEYHGTARENANGISIVFFKLPEAGTYNTYDANYKNYDPQTYTGNGGDFINRFRWDEFLATYYFYADL